MDIIKIYRIPIVVRHFPTRSTFQQLVVSLCFSSFLFVRIYDIYTRSLYISGTKAIYYTFLKCIAFTQNFFHLNQIDFDEKWN